MATAKIQVRLAGLQSQANMSLKLFAHPGAQNAAALATVSLTYDTTDTSLYWGTVDASSLAGVYRVMVYYSNGDDAGSGYIYLTNTTAVHPVVDDPWSANSSSTIVGTSISGVGADETTITVTVSGSPLADADVWITSDAAGLSVVAGTLQTNGSGQQEFLLDHGTTYYFWLQKSGYNSITGTSFVAAASNSFTTTVASAEEEAAAETLTAAQIAEIAASPRKIVTDEGSVEERPADELIKLDQYLNAKAVDSTPLHGLRISRFKPAGSV